MAALMELPVKFIWSHDAFRVGEDGPTHEPVEQEAQVRLMEKIKNHSGKNSMLVLRPADVNEATEAWRMAMENDNTPTGLIFLRQNITNLPEGTNYADVSKGAYIIAGSDEDYDMGILIEGKYRGLGYSREALELLLRYAFKVMGAGAVHNVFEEERDAALKVHLDCGFREAGRENGIVHLLITADDHRKITLAKGGDDNEVSPDKQKI
jgi:transketolase